MRSVLVGCVAVAAIGMVGCGDDAPTTAEPSGALIEVSMTSRVGVLLEDVPAPLRDRAAAEVLARPSTHWEQRARTQISATRLRLTYRRWLALAAGQLKGQLPLPPTALWTITLDPAGPRRETVDGHDLITIGYTFAGTLLSDVDSVVSAERSLVEIGAVWDEPFVFPIDPELLLQRTGFACIRESFASGTQPIDGENAITFFDHTCLATDNVEARNCHHSVPSWPVDCDRALADSIGRVPATLRFERVAWDPEVAAAARIGDAPPEFPDLAVSKSGLENRRLIYRYFRADSCAIAEGCVGAPGWRRLLQFDATIENLGRTPLHMGDPTTSTLAQHHVFEWSQCHAHDHFRFYGDFGLTGQTVIGSKRAFCLLSTTRYSNNESTPLTTDYDTCKYQGIAAGWGDDYYAGLDCQWLDVTGVDTGVADVDTALTFTANPNRFLCEGALVLDGAGNPTFAPSEFVTTTNMTIDRPACEFTPGYDANNVASSPVTIPRSGGYVTAPCDRGQLGPRRDCGFTAQAGQLACSGASVMVSCTASGTAPQLLRVCETSEVLGTGVACTDADALGGGVVDGGSLTTEVRCPIARDPSEPGGSLAIYASPAFAGDAASPVACTVL